MAGLARVCSECGVPLSGKGPRALTCSDPCRAKRSRRIRGLNTADSTLVKTSTQHEINRIAHGEHADAIRDAVRKELAPIVRQAITEDTLRAISDLVALTPLSVAALRNDLEGDDRVVRQRAYQTALRYTVGHTAIVTPEDTKEQSQMVVNFHLPRPDAEAPQELTVDDMDVVVLQECDMCHNDKPLSEFETGSTRCTLCFETWKASIVKQFAE